MMKRMFLFVSLLALAAGLTGCAGGIEMFNFGGAGKAGRFQVVAVPSAVPSINGTVIKVDTTTGETWYTIFEPHYQPNAEWHKFKN
jgi:hypothetical protein